MEQLGGPPTYGEPGGPAGPPAPEGYDADVNAKLKANLPAGTKTRMKNGQLMMQIRPQGYFSLKWVQANQFERKGGQWRKRAGGGGAAPAAPTGSAGMQKAMQSTIGMGWG